MNARKLLNSVQTYFYVRPSKLRGKPGVLYVRLTVNSRKLVCSVPEIHLEPRDFDKRGQTVKMSSVVHQQANAFIAHIRRIVLDRALNAESGRQILTSEALRTAINDYFTPEDVKAGPTFLALYALLMVEQKKTVGKEISVATYKIRERYLQCLTRAFCDIGIDRVPVSKLTADDLDNVRTWLLQNNAVGYAGRIFTGVGMCLKYAKLKKLTSYNMMNETRSITIDKSPDLYWLEPEQVEKISQLDLTGLPKAIRVRDAFVFCCFTGLAIGDYEMLNPARRAYLVRSANSPRQIEPGQILHLDSGQKVLIGRRRKTGTMFRVPLEAQALAIIDRYGGLEGMPFSLYGVGPLLNVICKDLNLSKTIRFHTARKTYANYLINVRQINTHLVPEIMGWKKFEEVLPYTRVSAQTLADQFTK